MVSKREFYATVAYGRTNPNMPSDGLYLLPASSWAVRLHKDGSLPPVSLPRHIKSKPANLAADSGGFVATRIWGDYRYTLAHYVQWLHSFTPRWAAMMDYCCEQEITTGKAGIVRERQHKTTANVLRTWSDYQNAPWLWIPTIQGWEVEDYIRHAEELQPHITTMQQFYQSPHFRVGIGTLCARASVKLINAVVAAVAKVLPNVWLHLWGVKLAYLQSGTLHPNVLSFDSAAWSGAIKRHIDIVNVDRHRLGMSCTEYDYCVSLPNYLAKVESALCRSTLNAVETP